MPDHYTTESSTHSHQYTQKLKLKDFLPKLILLESRDHCDSKISVLDTLI